jgi:hypothetical protein
MFVVMKLIASFYQTLENEETNGKGRRTNNGWGKFGTLWVNDCKWQGSEVGIFFSKSSI